MVLNNIDSLKTVSQSSEPEAARAAAAQLLPRPVAATVARVKPPWGELLLLLWREVWGNEADPFAFIAQAEGYTVNLNISNRIWSDILHDFW